MKGGGRTYCASDRNGMDFIENYDAIRIGTLGVYCEEGLPLYYVNHNMLKMLGYETRDEFESSTSGLVENAVFPEDIPALYEEIGVDYYEGQKYDVTYRFLKKDGSCIYVIDKGEVVRDADGRLVMMCVCMDVTNIYEKNRNIQNELRSISAREKVISDMAKTLYSFFMTVDINTWTFSFISGDIKDGTGEHLSCYSKYEDVYKDFYKRTDTAYRKRAERLLSKENLEISCRKPGNVGTDEFLIRMNDGRKEWYEINVFSGRSSKGDPLIHFLFRNVSNLHDNEELRKTLRANKIFLNSMPPDFVTCALINLDEDSQIRLIRENEKIREVHVIDKWDEYLEKEILSKMKDVEGIEGIHSKANLERLRQYKAGDTVTLEYFSTTGSSDGKHRPLMTVLNFIEQDDVSYATTFTTVNTRLEYEEKLNMEIERLRRLDEEQRAILEKALEDAEKASRAKSDFLFNMSHDIRTPMNAVVGYTELLQKNLDNREKAEDYIEKIKDSSDFLLSFINNILELAGIESGRETLNETMLDDRDVLESVMNVFEAHVKNKNISLEIDSEVEHHIIMADETKIREIFLNIIENAFKYTPAGGRITIKLRELPGSGPGYAVFESTIEDTGIGMSEEFLSRVFDAFERERSSTDSKVKGTGIGMHIVKKLVDMMGGTIDVKSKPGEGTKVTVRLEHRIAEYNEKGESHEKGWEYDKSCFRGKRLLLAEDNELNAEIAIEFLKEYDFLIERAADGVQCTDMMSKSEPGYYDAILMDIQMPGRNGYEATKIIRGMPDSRAKVPVIAMTANALEEDVRNAFDAGMDYHVAKPFKSDILLDVLAKALKK